MTELIITPNYDKKTARFKGTIAGGESVKVTIVGAAKWLSSGLRLRVVCGCSKTVAMFPLKSEDGTVSSFEVVGDDLIAAPLELNTIQARFYTQGLATTAATFIVEDIEKNILYFQDSYELHGWVKRDGDEEPYDLNKFPELIEDWRKQIEGLIVDAKEVDGGIEVTICDGVSPAETFIILNGRDGQPGEPGRKGDDGKSLTFNDLTEAQKAELKGPKGDPGDGITDELKALPDKVTENAQAIEVNRVAINTEENRAKGAEKELLARIKESKANAAAAMTAASKAQDTADRTVTEIATLVGDDTGDKRKSVRTIAAEEVAKVVANAPADLDTLKEIADYIESDKTGAAQMVTQIDANAKAISAEEKRAQNAEAALGEEIEKKVDAEEGKGLSTNDYTKEDKEKLSKAYTPDNPPPTPDLSGYAKKVDLPYRLIEQPAGDIQLQNRSMTHLTDANITLSWSASASEWNEETMENITHEATDVDWVKKETHDFINEGDETFVARFPWLPGFLMPITGVADVDPDIFYNISEILDEHGNYIDGFIEKVDCVVESVVYGVLSYRAYSPEASSSFVMTKEEGGDVFQGSFLGLWLSISYNEEYGAESYWYADDVGFDDIVFANDLVPPEVGEHPDGYWQFELGEDFKELPNPGETFSCYVYWNDWLGDFTGPRYRVDITLSADMPDFELTYGARSAKASCRGIVKNSDGKIGLDLGEAYVNWYLEEQPGEWDDTIGDYTYIPTTQVSVNCENYTLQTGVDVNIYADRVRQGSEMEDSSVVDVGQKVTITATDSYDFSSHFNSTSLRVTEKFKFLPPEPTEDNGARDLMLCVDLTKGRDIELEGVTPTEEGLFSLASGRTLISVTEPVADTLYAEIKTLPAEIV